MLFINLLTILGDTAAGADDVGYWPNSGGFLDWAGSTFFVINSLALSGLAGMRRGLVARSGRTARRICGGRNAGRAVSVGVALHAGSEFALGSAIQGGVPQSGSPLAGMGRVLSGNDSCSWR